MTSAATGSEVAARNNEIERTRMTAHPSYYETLDGQSVEKKPQAVFAASDQSW